MNISVTCSGNNDGDGGGGGTTDGEDQDDSSSSSLLNDANALDYFRKEWQRELENSPQHIGKLSDSRKSDEKISHTVEDKAKVLFQLGVENEEKGKLYEAIQFYRRAFQLVPDIEFRLSQQVYSRPVGNQVVESVSKDVARNDDSDLDETDFDEGDIEEEEEDEAPFRAEKIDLLTHLQYLMQRKCQRTICTPQHEPNGTHISALPMEIFLYILRWVVSTDLDLRSLEKCSRVSRGFYICCRDPEIWKLACARIWGVKCGSLGASGYISWRDMYIKRPKLHFSGCYISKTTYIRPGENSFQDQFYRPWHLVQYYRYLRFFSDGQVLMLTTVEDPLSSVGLLRGRSPPPRQPPVCKGYFRLHENMVSLVVTPNPDSKRTRPNTNSAHNHTFHLELEIVSHRNRRHGKLVWHGYSAFTKRNGIETNTTFELDAGRYPPFWFSRVKSYTAETYHPLM